MIGPFDEQSNSLGTSGAGIPGPFVVQNPLTSTQRKRYRAIQSYEHFAEVRHELSMRYSWESNVKTFTLLVTFVVALVATSAAQSQDFYKGKTIRVVVGHNVGNDYDVGTRLLTKHLSKYIPGNPTIIVQNIPQAAGIAAANFLQGQAPRDGLVLGTFTRNYPNQAIMRQANVEGDPRKLNWLGATSFPSRVCIANPKANVKAASDLFTQEMIVGGGPGVSSSNSILPTVFNRVLGTKFRVITGYKGAQDAVLAIERGELEGVCATLAQFRPYEQLFAEGKLRVILHAEEALPEFPGIPSIYDFVKTVEQRQFLRFVFRAPSSAVPMSSRPVCPKTASR